MESTDYIISKSREFAGERSRILVGVCGRAGAGKTTLVEKISSELNDKEIKNIKYSGDWRFNLDSETRKYWLQEKWKVGVDAYLYAINQFNWWNFDLIYQDLAELISGNPLELNQVYNRLTGKKDLSIKIPALDTGIILFENCVLGGVENLETLEIVLLVNTPDVVCFERLLKKDAARRSLPEILTRNLITTYSENIFLKMLMKNFSFKTIACDSNGNLTPYPEIAEVTHIPVPFTEKVFHENKKAAIFCDLEGTIIKHFSEPFVDEEEIEFIPQTIKKLKEFRDKGYFLVLTTSRPGNLVFGIVEKLRERGLAFDQIVCDLPIGPRHLIADSKEGKSRAFAHVLERDGGIKDLDLS